MGRQKPYPPTLPIICVLIHRLGKIAGKLVNQLHSCTSLHSIGMASLSRKFGYDIYLSRNLKVTFLIWVGFIETFSELFVFLGSSNFIDHDENNFSQLNRNFLI